MTASSVPTTPHQARNILIPLLRQFDITLLNNGFQPLSPDQRTCATDTTRTTEAIGMFNDLLDRVVSGQLAQTLRERFWPQMLQALDDMNPEAELVRRIQSVMNDHGEWDSDTTQEIAEAMNDCGYYLEPAHAEDIDDLTAEFNDWCATHKLEPHSADEMLLDPNVSGKPEHAAYLRRFLVRWERAEENAR